MTVHEQSFRSRQKHLSHIQKDAEQHHHCLALSPPEQADNSQAQLRNTHIRSVDATKEQLQAHKYSEMLTKSSASPASVLLS